MTKQKTLPAASFVFLLILTLPSCIIKTANEVKQEPAKIQSAESFLAKGFISYSQYEYEQAAVFFTDALRTYRSIDNPEGIVLSCINLSKTFLAKGNIRLAEAFIEKAKVIVASSPELQKSYLMNHIAIVASSIAIDKKNYVTAKEIIQPLLDKERSIVIDISIAAVQNRARIAVAEQAYDAEKWVQNFEAKLNASELPKPNQKARLLRFKAVLAHHRKQYDSDFAAALNLYRQTAHQTGIAATLEEWAEKQYQSLQYHASIEKLMRSLFIRIDLKDRKNAQSILALLEKNYHHLANTIQEQKTALWLVQLKSSDFNNWNNLFADYNDYP